MQRNIIGFLKFSIIYGKSFATVIIVGILKFYTQMLGRVQLLTVFKYKCCSCQVKCMFSVDIPLTALWQLHYHAMIYESLNCTCVAQSSNTIFCLSKLQGGTTNLIVLHMVRHLKVARCPTLGSEAKFVHLFFVWIIHA